MPTALPKPTPTAGIVALARYWVGSVHVRTGQTIEIGYVISNTTGHAEHLLLGASIKSARVASWVQSLADPSHDVVATVAPGLTTHIRYFTLPERIRPGEYDVAWGLRNAATGSRAALVFAPSVLRVSH